MPKCLKLSRTIEKEIMVCDLKLERVKRLFEQRVYLEYQVGILAREIHTLEVETSKAPSQDSCGKFFVNRLLKTYTQSWEILNRENEALAEQLKISETLQSQRRALERDEQAIFRSMSPGFACAFRENMQGLRKVESQWNSTSEDITDLSEGILFLEKNLDYLRRCRFFLFAAKTEYINFKALTAGDPVRLMSNNNISQANDMASGADINLIMAQKEWSHVACAKIIGERFQLMLRPLFAALLDDMNNSDTLEKSIKAVEGTLESHLLLTKAMKEKREFQAAKLKSLEKVRKAAFLKLTKRSI